MKAIIAIAILAPLLCSCTTLANRRDLYSPQGKVNGPYTRLLHKGVPKPAKTKIIKVETSSPSPYDGKQYAPPRS